MAKPWTLDREPQVVFCGWIIADKSDLRTLKELGVYGPMVHKHNPLWDKRGIFEHCYATAETMRRLISELDLSNPGSFTAVDAITDQVLPAKYQKSWRND